jgi:hypothetical protein
MRAIAFLAAFILVFPVFQAHGEGVSVHAGLQTVSFGADVGDYYNLPSGPGLALLVGFPSSLTGVPIDINLGLRKVQESNSGDDAEYRWLEVGPRFPFGRESSRVRLEWFAGAGLYDLKIGDLTFDTATGLYGGLGIEDFATERITGRFQIKGSYWQTDTGSIDAACLSISMMYGYRF